MTSTKLFSVNILNARFNDLIEVFVLISAGTMMLSFVKVLRNDSATSIFLRLEM